MGRGRGREKSSGKGWIVSVHASGFTRLMSERGGWRGWGRGFELLGAWVLWGALVRGGAADWPQILGPQRNGVSSESIAASWGAEGPRARWSRPVGAGFAGPAVAGGRVYLHHREKEDEVLECLDLATSRTLWKSPHATTYRDSFGFDEGPRAVPTVVGDRVYVLGAAGMVRCVSTRDGAAVWQVDASRTLGAGAGFFGFACSPLVVSNVVVAQVGGRPGAGIVGWDAATGALRWKATDHEAGYASPVVASWAGRERVVSFTREGLVVLDLASGAIRAEFRWRSRQQASVNAATPLVLDRNVFLTSSYDTGAVLLDLSGAEPRRVWSADDALSSHYASVVAHEGFVFGFHGRQETGAVLRCIEAKTGRVRWTESGLGSGAVIRAAERLVVLTERGELLVAPAGPDGFRSTARAQVLGAGVRAMPALAEGCLVARDPRKLVCLELGAGAGRASP